MEKITVVVPVYNMEKYVKRAIDSLLAQTYRNFEIVLVDDGSTDNGGQICDAYAAEYDFITAVHKENGGLSSARNAGIRAATGEYIVFPDPDDWVSEDYLQKFVDMQESNHSDLEICGYYIADEKSQKEASGGRKQVFLNKDEALSQLFIGGGFSGFAWNKLYHMDIIRKNNLWFDEELGMAQDLHFAFRYILKCEKISYNGEPVYFYYQHIGGVTNTNAGLTPRKISGLKTYEKMIEIADRQYPSVASTIHATLANVSMQFLYIYYESGMKDEKLQEHLITNIRKNRKHFMCNPHYGLMHKLLWGVVYISPRLYHKCRKLHMG